MNCPILTHESLIVERDAAVVTVTINRPDRLNALDTQVFIELIDVLNALTRDPTIVALILTGAGTRAFVAGADIQEMQRMSPEEGERFAALGQAVTRRFEALPFPVIACVDGHALGGGCELAMSCDFIYATERSSFGQPEVALGLIPCFGGCVRLARLIGPARARELIYTGRRIPAQAALEMGLVNAVHPDRATMLDAARATIATIATRSKTAVAVCKRIVMGALDAPLGEGLAMERIGFRVVLERTDGPEGMAAFVAKRPPAFAEERQISATLGRQLATAGAALDPEMAMSAHGARRSSSAV